jgi:phosphopantothenate synthetase
MRKFLKIASDLLRAAERGSASDDLSGKKSPEARITMLQHAANTLKSANRPVLTLYLVDLVALNHKES